MKDLNWRLSEGEDTTKKTVFVADSADSDDKIERSDNRIFFYSEVNRPKILELNKEIRSLSLDILHNSKALSIDPANIYIHINKEDYDDGYRIMYTVGGTRGFSTANRSTTHDERTISERTNFNVRLSTARPIREQQGPLG